MNTKYLLNYVGNVAYPIGAIYTTTQKVNPSLIWGGEWELISGKLLMGISSAIDYSVYTGSNDGQVLSHSHYFSHTHTTSSAGNHDHAISHYKSNYGYNGSTGTQYRLNSSGGVVFTTSSDSSHFSSHGMTLSGATNTTNMGVYNNVQTTTVFDNTDLNLPPSTAVYIWKRIA